ncbi:hypothetical protein A1O3_05956 [Capronia epimyces CBS 606.96]|uniref:JmjC domain-containing protein n=1 Tax=Capronia epimyces CBS 606.96 TaxID=1182542 RepID=W9Y7Q0_9EURO|nr:uncharacterized protein A1O3_05956 [Capronia epimyces CBS 606.96]EXJ85281.1 hypothetical protein A1O3_05956 [Capronia epimyces CBS 606.96]
MRCLSHRTKGVAALSQALSSACPVRQLQLHLSHRQFGTSQARNKSLQAIPLLTSWNADIFHEKAYLPALPARLPRSTASIPPACRKWFIHDGDIDFNLTSAQRDNGDGLTTHVQVPRSSELRSSFWSEHETTIVPLELTSKTPSASLLSVNDTELAHGIQNHNVDGTFHRVEAPLKLLLTYLSNPMSPGSKSLREPSHSIYLAQCEISSLPLALQRDIPTPRLLEPQRSIRGDVYSSSLWLGRPPTYTPLHRDPNPNLFLQLAGRKVMRLLPPEIGDAVFADIQRQLPSTRASASSAIRGEEMMAGPEKTLLHDAVWLDEARNRYREVIENYEFEAELELGDGLFIPKGWWHSVKGVGEGVTASVNWWFR